MKLCATFRNSTLLWRVDDVAQAGVCVRNVIVAESTHMKSAEIVVRTTCRNCTVYVLSVMLLSIIYRYFSSEETHRQVLLSYGLRYDT